MSQLNDIPLSTLHFYLTASYPCGYIPEKLARSQVATPSYMIDSTVYSELVQHGFRRSGTYTYRPSCDECRACVPLRVPVSEFAPSRTQRRAWKKHENLTATPHSLHDSPEYFKLYQRYQKSRHPNGGMDNDDRESYQNFLLQSHVDSFLVEFREQGELRMVSVIDILSDGLSSVYTFYDPDLPQGCLGVYNVLWQIELCKKLELDYVYLGYWIKESPKMAYKTGYRPAQGLQDGVWKTFDKETL